MIQLKRGPTSAIQKDILEDGQLGYNTETLELKMGDGTTQFSSLPKIIPDPRVYTSSQDVVSINKGEFSLTWDGSTLGYMNAPSATIGSSTNMWHEMYVYNVNNVQSISTSGALDIKSTLLILDCSGVEESLVIQLDGRGMHPESPNSVSIGDSTDYWSHVWTHQLNFDSLSGAHYINELEDGLTVPAISFITRRIPNTQIILANGKQASHQDEEDFAIKYNESASGAGRLGIYTNNNQVYLTVGDTGPIYKRNTDTSGNEIPILELYTWTPRITVDGQTQTVANAHGTAVKIGMIAIVYYSIEFKWAFSGSGPIYITDFPFEITSSHYPLGDYFYQAGTSKINGYISIEANGGLVRRMESAADNSVGNPYGGDVKAGTLWEGSFVCRCAIR